MDESIYDEFAAGVDEAVDTFYDEVMDLMAIKKEGSGFRATGGVRE